MVQYEAQCEKLWTASPPGYIVVETFCEYAENTF